MSVNSWGLNLYHEAFIENLVDDSVTGWVVQETDSDEAGVQGMHQEALWVSPVKGRRGSGVGRRRS